MKRKTAAGGAKQPQGDLRDDALLSPRVPAAFDGVIDPFVHGDEIEIDAPFDAESMVEDAVVTMFGNFIDPLRVTWQEKRTLAGADLRDPVAFYCRAALLRDADGGEARLRYTVVPPAGGAKESELLRLSIRKGAQTEPPAPWVEGTVDDQGMALRMEDLNGRDVVVQVAEHTGNVGDTIVLRWKPNEGELFKSPPQTVPTDGGTLTFTVPYDIANESPGTVAVHYGLTRPGGSEIVSASRTLEVTAAVAPPQLSAPFVVEADEDGRLDPLAVNTLTVRIPAMDVTDPPDSLTLTWLGPTTEGSLTVKIDALPPGGLSIPIDMAVLAHDAGHRVRIYYVLTWPDDTRVSDEGFVDVDAIAHESLALPRPTITQADDTELDLSTFEGDGQVIIAPYRLAIDRQRYWLTLTGNRDDGSDKEVTIATGAPITVSGSSPIVLGSIARSDLEEFADGTEITLAMKLTFNQSEDEDEAIRFRSMRLTLHKSDARWFPAPTVDGANASDVLDPRSVSAFRVRLPADATFQPGDTAWVSWFVASGSGGSIRLDIRAEPGETAEVPRDDRFLALGEHVLIHYIVMRGAESLLSSVRRITIKPHGTSHPSGVLPWFSEASGFSDLDLSRFSGDAHPLLEPYYLLTGGQRYWMTLSGIRSNGLPLSFTIAENTIIPAVTDGAPVSFKAVPRAYLEQFKSGSYIHLVVKITLDKSQDPGNAVSFGRRIIIHQT